MVTAKSVNKQLKRLKFNVHAWGRAEIRELPNILMPEEKIYECVNGMYEGGFALLVATESRVLLIDKKPLNFLTVEDLRFDMINEIDYNHRLIGAQITVSAGSKNLKFKSYNQPRLRKLITHVQHCMAESKKKQSEGQEDQKQHLEQINQQLQAYLIAQHQQQQALRERLDQVSSKSNKGKGHSSRSASDNTAVSQLPAAPKPSPELADYLFAQSLLKEYRELQKSGEAAAQPDAVSATVPNPTQLAQPTVAATPQADQPINSQELYEDGMREIFSRRENEQQSAQAQPAVDTPVIAETTSQQPAAAPQTAPANAFHGFGLHNPLEINPLTIAYSRLPMALRHRKFGRPSFHAHSGAQAQPPLSTPAAASMPR